MEKKPIHKVLQCKCRNAYKRERYIRSSMVLATFSSLQMKPSAEDKHLPCIATGHCRSACDTLQARRLVSRHVRSAYSGLRRTLATLATLATPPAMQRVWLCIAVDGPAAAGKGTLSRALAQRFGCRYLDTGLLYRAVGWKALQAGICLDDQPALAALSGSLTPADMAQPQLRSEGAASAASQVSVLPAVRATLLEFQRSFAKETVPGFHGAVLDGRDIGSTVCPGAQVKLFITASPEVRARRRWQELRDKGAGAGRDSGHVLKVTRAIVGSCHAVLKRGAQLNGWSGCLDVGKQWLLLLMWERNRVEAPLRATSDALVLDTSSTDAAKVLAAAAAHVLTSCPWMQDL
ncbi:MAG: hypothetical protein WDW38_007997 [Sanguina aurantia]